MAWRQPMGVTHDVPPPRARGCDFLRAQPRKAKPTKHTAAEIASKIKAATGNIGGGAAGLKDRMGGMAGHSKFQCKLCGAPAPSMKSLKVRRGMRGRCAVCG